MFCRPAATRRGFFGREAGGSGSNAISHLVTDKFAGLCSVGRLRRVLAIGFGLRGWFARAIANLLSRESVRLERGTSPAKLPEELRRHAAKDFRAHWRLLRRRSALQPADVHVRKNDLFDHHDFDRISGIPRVCEEPSPVLLEHRDVDLLPEDAGQRTIDEGRPDHLVENKAEGLSVMIVVGGVGR
jgi:hypothetical protein